MRFIFRYLKPYYKRMAVGLSIKMTGTLIELFIPGILGSILDTILDESRAVDIYAIVKQGLLMILCAGLAMLCNVIANRMASKVARDSSEAIRHDLFKRMMTLSCRQTDAFTIPSLEARLTSDTYNVHQFIGMMQRLGVRAPMLLLGGLIITIYLDAKLALVMIALLPVIFLVTYGISNQGVPLYRAVQQAVDGMVRVVREDAQGIRVIKALSREHYENARYDAVNRALVKKEKRAALTMGAVNPIMNLLMNLGISFVVLVGAYRVMGGTSLSGNIVSFTQYFTIISTAMMSITRILIRATKSTASAHRIQEVVDCAPDLLVLPETTYPRREENGIVFDNVSFSYNGVKENLKDIRFHVKKGETLGIIGATGSGKSTILNLLMRFYDVDGGAVRIDGRDVRTIPEEELHTMFGVAMQNDFLYADTIAENIRFGRELTDEELHKACRIAQAEDFILQFREGYEHPLSQKGTNISGGQKQRLLIARAIAKRPDILILDDSSSALDYQTDARLRQALVTELGGMTRVIVAQRVSAVQHADTILVLEGGQILAAGRHEELMESSEVYREIANTQMGGAFLD